MIAQVIYLNKLLSISDEERIKLDKMQDKLSLNHIEIAFMENRMSKYQVSIVKMRYHNQFRERWRLVNGDKVDECQNLKENNIKTNQG